MELLGTTNTVQSLLLSCVQHSLVLLSCSMGSHDLAAEWFMGPLGTTAGVESLLLSSVQLSLSSSAAAGAVKTWLLGGLWGPFKH